MNKGVSILSCQSQLRIFTPFRFYWRERRDRSQVPRIADDRDKRMLTISDMGYTYRYHRQGTEALPRIDNSREQLFHPKYKVREPWNKGSKI